MKHTKVQYLLRRYMAEILPIRLNTLFNRSFCLNHTVLTKLILRIHNGKLLQTNVLRPRDILIRLH